ncbi:hypothetical protein OHB41_27380 [Streptomyces sp. NBC_01571]|uniref:hypothetical protein n=1 Tax=Streptomyces sp. NBC_01571 TaxID=2975883 RepID=UPI00224DF4F0|nr:hypothetical protein [Streptomyces sp. NBC_01571]MCX4576828.1 hypothetical protein [Streptomyces sp. NBC_01571]
MELLILLAITYLVGVDNTHGKYEQAGIKKPPPKPKAKWEPTRAPDTFRNASYNAAAKTHYGLLAGAHLAGGLRDGWRSAYLKKPGTKPSGSSPATPPSGPSGTTPGVTVPPKPTTPPAAPPQKPTTPPTTPPPPAAAPAASAPAPTIPPPGTVPAPRTVTLPDRIRKDPAMQPNPPVPHTATVDDKGVHVTTASGKSRTYSGGEVITLTQVIDLAEGAATLCQSSSETCLELVDESTQLAADCDVLIAEITEKGVGENLIGKCEHLKEQLDLQAAAAKKLHDQIQGGEEACRTASANAEVRHGQIFRAVADSPLTTPAERDFYNAR